MALLQKHVEKSLRRKESIFWWNLESDIQKYLVHSRTDNWNEKFVPLIEGVVHQSGDQWSSQLGVQFNVRHLLAEAWFEEYTLQFAQPITQTTGDFLHGILMQAQAEGWTIGETQRHLTQTFDAWQYGSTGGDWSWLEARKPAYRAEMIARTETIRAANAGSDALYRRWNVEEREWSSASDGRTRDSHRAADGQVKSMDKPFDIGGYKMMYPGDASLGAPPSEFINCRCTTYPVITAKKRDEIQKLEVEAAEQERDARYYELRDINNYKDIQSLGYNDFARWQKLQKAKIDRLSASQQRAITKYTGNDFRQLNSALRSQDPNFTGYSVRLTNTIKKQVETINRGLRTGRVGENIVSYRGCSSAAFPKEWANTPVGNLVGAEFQDLGFFSTSVRAPFTGEYNLTVLIPEGTDAAYINSISEYGSEHEVLIASGQRFEILEATENEHGARFMTILALPSDGS